jgi:hypothetical protein
MSIGTVQTIFRSLRIFSLSLPSSRNKVANNFRIRHDNEYNHAKECNKNTKYQLFLARSALAAFLKRR